MNIDKQALRISELEELNELLREKVKKLESDLWDKEQLRQVYSEKSFDLECKVRELEARNQKDFVWRGKEISRLDDEVDELKEKLAAAEMQIVNLKQNCENDPRIHEIVDLKESVAELAAENVGMKELIEQRANWFQMAQKLGEDLDAAEKRNAEQREYYEGVISDGSKRIAELEARVIVLPQRLSPEGYHIDEAYMVDDTEGEYLDRDAVIDAIRAAGIKVKGE
ncbi:TPA: ead/Ea22-like family protein [Salmonella enterica]|uniref:hypothetical protein n=1 Tax=Salmonella enterica TaxID=28901 RepID=UPI0009AAD1C0|nr:hypothetical protein [Salmonella enterica]SUG37792.1 Ead protein [Salmonella enterica subsp. arizonae]